VLHILARLYNTGTTDQTTNSIHVLQYPPEGKTQQEAVSKQNWQRQRRHVPPKRRLTFNRLHGIISQKT
jgi:hypothetical protein